MKKTLFFFLFYLTPLISAAAQPGPGATPNPQSSPAPQVAPSFPRGGRSAQIANQGLGNGSETRVSSIPEGLALRYLIVQKYAQPLYRKPTDDELSAIAPDLNVINKYREFLRRPKTGIFRILVDAGCSDNVNVMVVTDPCMKHTMPGAGSSFSFRTRSYRIPRLADLMLNSKGFYVTGELMHGILTNLGDVPIETVGPQTPGMRYIAEFQPADDLEKAREIDRLLVKGVDQDGYTYGRVAATGTDATYALRVVAYRGNMIRSVNGATYDEFDFDKRQDLTIVFRTVDRSADGSFTIIWAELSKADSPKLKAKAARPGN